MNMENRPSPAVQTCGRCLIKFQIFDGDPPHCCEIPALQTRIRQLRCNIKAACEAIDLWNQEMHELQGWERSMKINAEKMRARDLQPGDLFSTSGPEYWDHFKERGAIGEKVYIRTDCPAELGGDADTDVFKITIET